MECSVNILVGGGGVELFSVRADFLSSCSINCTDRGAEVSNFNCEFAYSSFYFYQVLLRVFYSSIVWCLHISDCYFFLLDGPLCHCIMSLSAVAFFVLKSISSAVDTATPPFF